MTARSHGPGCQLAGDFTGRPERMQGGGSVGADRSRTRPAAYRVLSVRSRLIFFEGLNWLALKKRISSESSRPTRVFTF